MTPENEQRIAEIAVSEGGRAFDHPTFGIRIVQPHQTANYHKANGWRELKPLAQASAVKSVRAQLESLANRNSLENGSNTPDFILATYLLDCLKAFDTAVTKRGDWYGRHDRPDATDDGKQSEAKAEPKRPVFANMFRIGLTDYGELMSGKLLIEHDGWWMETGLTVAVLPKDVIAIPVPPEYQPTVEPSKAEPESIRQWRRTT